MKIRMLYLLTALLLGVAAIEPSPADSKPRLSAGRDLQSLASGQDYRSASNISLRLANEHSLRNETAAACEELAKSLDYYRKALVADGDRSTQAALVNGDRGDGMEHIRAQFGCTRTQLS